MKYIVLLAVLLFALVLLVSQPVPALITVTDCLLQSGYSHAVPETPVTTLAGLNAWVDGLGEQVLTEGISVGFEFLDDSDGARRTVNFYAYEKDIYVFVYKHPADPLKRLPGEASSVWHGDCLLKIISN